MFRLRITSPGQSRRCMCKLQAGVSREEERIGGRGRNAEIVVVTPLPDTLLLFIPITLNIGVNIVRSSECSRDKMTEVDQNIWGHEKIFEILAGSVTWLMVSDEMWHLSRDPGRCWSLLTVPGYKPLLLLPVNGKNHKPILAQIIGYHGANWASNIICIFTNKYPNKSMRATLANRL